MNSPEVFNPSIRAFKSERSFIIDSLIEFYHDGLIDDCADRIKGGKEAVAYVCTASGHLPRLAAKLYRPRHSRSMRNYSVYKENRFMIGQSGGVLKGSRELRAIRKRTRLGREMESESWIAHEFTTLQLFYDAGVAVPEPVALHGNAILMELAELAGRPAPTLHDVVLDAAQAKRIFPQLLEDIRLMLLCGRIHGDLSPYNVLVTDDGYRIIDVPQAVNPLQNSQPLNLLVRDIERIGDYFAPYGLNTDPIALASDLLEEHLAR